jgi:hypothetical protein
MIFRAPFPAIRTQWTGSGSGSGSGCDGGPLLVIGLGLIKRANAASITVELDGLSFAVQFRQRVSDHSERLGIVHSKSMSANWPRRTLRWHWSHSRGFWKRMNREQCCWAHSGLRQNHKSVFLFSIIGGILGRNKGQLIIIIKLSSGAGLCIEGRARHAVAIRIWRRRSGYGSKAPI